MPPRNCAAQLHKPTRIVYIRMSVIVSMRSVSWMTIVLSLLNVVDLTAVAVDLGKLYIFCNNISWHLHTHHTLFQNEFLHYILITCF
jgi:hypothetical protein